MQFTNVSIPTHELPDFTEASLQPIHKKYVLVLWLNYIILLLFLSGIPIGLALFIEDFPQWILLLMAALGTFILVFQAIEISQGFPKRMFGVRERDIIFQKGFFYFKETVVPLKRIQHVEIKQGPALRALKLYSIKLYTAGAATGDLVIDGLTLEVAKKIKAHVLEVTEEDE